MFNQIIITIYFFLPAAFANITAALSARLFPGWNYPLDGYKKLNGSRILGDHKTIRGLVFGTLVAQLVFTLQSLLNNPGSPILLFRVIDYSNIFPLTGLLLGFGALAGDSVKSFFKRMFKIKPGQSWIPFDQIDWILGAVILSSLSNPHSVLTISIALLVFPLLHLLTKYIGYRFKLDNKPY